MTPQPRRRRPLRDDPARRARRHLQPLALARGRPGDWPDDPLFRRYFNLDIDIVARETPLDTMLAMVERLASAFDLVVTDFNAREVEQDAHYARLQPANPAIVVANADHFGRSGPYATWHGDELTGYALGGYWAVAGDPDRAPLRVPGHQAGFHAGMQLTIAALAAVRHARLTGEGPEVETTGAESMLGAHWSTTVAWTHEGRVFERTGPDLFRARDGWVFFYRLGMYPNLFTLIEREDLRDDPRWETPRGWFAHSAEIWEMVEAWCADYDVNDIVERAQALRIPATPMGTAAGLLADPMLTERGSSAWTAAPATPDSPTAGRRTGAPAGRSRASPPCSMHRRRRCPPPPSRRSPARRRPRAACPCAASASSN